MKLCWGEHSPWRSRPDVDRRALWQVSREPGWWCRCLSLSAEVLSPSCSCSSCVLCPLDDDFLRERPQHITSVSPPVAQAQSSLRVCSGDSNLCILSRKHLRDGGVRIENLRFSSHRRGHWGPERAVTCLESGSLAGAWQALESRLQASFLVRCSFLLL